MVITTRHDSHASLAARGLRAGKHVFVEKPLSLTREGLAEIEAAYGAGPAGPRPILMVGFNRRFAPHIVKISRLLHAVAEPKAFVMTVNAGSVPPAHWTQDPAVGGGRIIGECCHFVDLLRFLADAPIRHHSVQTIPAGSADTATVQLAFDDGSIGAIHYFANGGKAFPKERLEVFAAGGVLQLDNFRRLQGYGWPGFSRESLWRQDKGQAACAAAFLDAIRGGRPAPIPFDQLVEVGRVCIDLARTAGGSS